MNKLYCSLLMGITGVSLLLTGCGDDSNATPSAPQQIGRIVVFGDSLSDIGNNTQASDQGASHAPITNFDPSQPNGLNESTWITYLAQNLTNHNSQVITYADLTTGANPSANIDMAWAGAPTGLGYYSGEKLFDSIALLTPNPDCSAPGKDPKDGNLYCIPGMEQQISLYFNQQPQNQDDSHTLFVLFAGSNDEFANMEKLVIALAEHKLPTGLYQPAVNVLHAITTLEAKGIPGGNIVVVNLPNLALTPGIQNMTLPPNKYHITRAKLIKLLEGLVFQYNASLNAILALNFSSQQGTMPHVFDANTWITDVLTHPQKYGLTTLPNNTFANCWEDTHSASTSTCPGAKGSPNGDYICTCTQQNPQYGLQHDFFFNSAHPSTYGHSLMAQALCQAFSQWHAGFNCNV